MTAHHSPLSKFTAQVLAVAVSAAPAFGAPQAAPARASDPVTTISVNVKVVTMPVTVRDKHGKIVRDLTKDDFTLQEDGRPQTIKYFSQETNLPLTLGLLVDTSWSQRESLDDERTASRKFLRQMLTQENDKAFVIHFDREVELLQDLTSDHEKLEDALDLLKASDRDSGPPDRDSRDSGSRGQGPPPDQDATGQDSRNQDSDGQDSGPPKGPPPDGRGGPSRGGTQLYDAVYLASSEVLKKQTGRKAIIVLSDGVDHGSKISIDTAIETAQRADTVVYAIYFAGKKNKDNDRGGPGGPGGNRGGGLGRIGLPGGWPGGGGGWPGGGGGGGQGGPGGGQGPGDGKKRKEESKVDGKKILDRIAKETGGRFFEVSKKLNVAEVYADIAEELRTQYSLGYTPDKDSAPSGYHHLQLQVKKKDLVVQTREGYYADTGKSASNAGN